jgi:hypothetical protein
MEWQYSSDGAAWTDAIADWSPSASMPFVKTAPLSVTKRYWQVTIASMSNPRVSEIFMGPAYTFNAQRSTKPTGELASNVQWNRTVGGLERSTKFGQTRRRRTYTVWLDEQESQLSDLEEAISYLGGLSKPFLFRDHLENYFLARFETDPFYDFDHADRTHLTLNFIEML